jgi:hypothetical protein
VRRSVVSLRIASRGREHLVELARSAELYLVIRDQKHAGVLVDLTINNPHP